MKNCPKCNELFDPYSIHGEKKFCSRKCANSRIKTQAQKDAARRHAINNPVGWVAKPGAYAAYGAAGVAEKWKEHRQEKTCLECKINFTVPYSKRFRKYCSVACSNKNKYHQNSSNKIISFVDGQKMDSGAEALFATKCNEHGILWSKNISMSFAFTDSNGKQRKYYPDFYMPDYDIWVEIKGLRYVREDDEIRRQSVSKPVFLIISNRFAEDFAKFLTAINKEAH